ncbi:hypothetical protein HNV11_14935 [Spirosoma taeanense]|uniref:Uncharacterized protein n=1 Tax=Spirosoma taeanense TaxID=2735870 RepID=A0A6M5YAP0_9BACT|nr:hypothetical protein [Spirosoma taeanense]QJW90584.1 hypothetical protein HNV11_14935 [Spirosoma taeanense]
MKTLATLTLAFSVFIDCLAQNKSPVVKDSIAKATNFSVPSSAAFNLLDVNPSKINRPGFAKDFKFDWVFNGTQISPNIAIEAQPIWLLFAKNKSYSEIEDFNIVERALYSLDLSLGTAQRKISETAGSMQTSQVQSLAFAAKLNLYSSKNPLYDDGFIKNYAPRFSEEEEKLETEKTRIEGVLNGLKKDSSSFANDINILKSSIPVDQLKLTQLLAQLAQLTLAIQNHINQFESIERKLNNIFDREVKATQAFVERYEKENWNSTIIDFGYGQVFNYSGDNIGNLQFFDKGNAFWLSGVIRIGKKHTIFGQRVMLNFMTRYITTTKTPNFTYGGNLRYGSKLINFFIEGVQTNYTKIEPGATAENTTTIAYGGDFKINNLFYVQLGIRTNYNKDFKLRDIIPLVNFNYLLPTQ